MPISANFDKPKCWGHLDGLIYAFPTSVNTLRATYEEITNTTKTTISCEFEYIFLILGQKYVYMRRGNVFYTRIDHTYQVRRPADNTQQEGTEVNIVTILSLSLWAKFGIVWVGD